MGAMVLCMLLVVLSVWASVADARRREIPNVSCVFIAACGLALRAVCDGAAAGEWLPHAAWGAGVLLVGAACEFALRALTGRVGVGLGDVKFCAAWACVLGWRVVPALALACMLGAVSALIRKAPTFPMAPWLTLVFVLALVLCG